MSQSDSSMPEIGAQIRRHNLLMHCGYGKTQRFEIRLKRGSHLRQNQARKSAPALRFAWIAALRRILAFSPQRALFPQPTIRKQQDLCLSVRSCSKTTGMPTPAPLQANVVLVQDTPDLIVTDVS